MYLDPYFKLMAERQASDLFITCGAPINIKINGVVAPVTTQKMDVETVRRIAYELMNKEQAREFVSHQSLQRRIMPLDVARVCLFLACELSDGMTGQILNVDGGVMAGRN